MIPLVSGKNSISCQTLDDMTAEAKTALHVDLAGSSDGEDSDGEDSESDSSSSSESSSSWDDILEDLATDVQCLIDLDQIIECPAPEAQKRGSGKGRMAPDWEPHLSYSDKIANRFPDAAASLVDRLARANWERFQRTNAAREMNIAAVKDEDQPATEAVVVTGAIQRAQSHAETVSKFNDSGLGDSVRTGSTYADTVMSYQAQGRDSVRIPPLPEGAKQGKPFDCVACSRQLIITNNAAWKFVFALLKLWLSHHANLFLDNTYTSIYAHGYVMMLHAGTGISSLRVGRTGSITLLSAMA